MQSPHALYADAFPREFGHAFWLLEPSDRPYGYFVLGVQIGDVLVLDPDGGYDYLFNICRPKEDSVNAGRTYDGFEHLVLDLDLETSDRMDWQSAGSCIGSSGGKIFSASVSASAPGLPVSVGAGLGFTTAHSSGALLSLPDGASRTDLKNHKRFKDWITRNIHAVFEHVNGDRFGREATSIFIVTGCDKSTESVVAASTNAFDLHKVWLNLSVASVGVDLSYSSSLQCPSSTRVTPITYSNDGVKNKNHCAFARGLTCTKRRDPIRSRITIKIGDISSDESWAVENKKGGSGFWPFSPFRSRSSSSSGSSPPPSTSSSTRSTPAPSPTSSCEDLFNLSSCPDLVLGDSDDDGEIHFSFPRNSRRDPWTEMNEHFLRLHPDYDYVISHTNDLPQVREQIPLLPEDHDVLFAVYEAHPEHTSNQPLDRPEPAVDGCSQDTRADGEPSSSSSQVPEHSFHFDPDSQHTQDSAGFQHDTPSVHSAGSVQSDDPGKHTGFRTTSTDIYPSIPTMPSIPKFMHTNTYSRAIDIPQDLWRAMESCEINSNVILPHAQKCLQSEQEDIRTAPDQYWISLVSDTNSTVEFVLACTANDIGRYPIFITTTLPFSALQDGFLYPRMTQLAHALLKVVPTNRVFSVFAPEPVTKSFCGIWTKLTDIRTYAEPYYHVNITFCDLKSFHKRHQTAQPDPTSAILRPADHNDLPAIRDLCEGFAIEGEPFVLDHEDALEEAHLLIQNSQVWVCVVRNPITKQDEITSLCAFTRTSSKVSMITKVYTNPRWRSRGCAERLVRRVCQELLKTKEYVVVYVAQSNAPINKVYHKVGFVGLGEDTNVEGVDPWIEVGFDRSKTILGHW